MKKKILMTMVTIMVAGLTACGGSEGSTNETTTPVASEENPTTGVNTEDAGCFDADGNKLYTFEEMSTSPYDESGSLLDKTKFEKVKEIVYPEGITDIKDYQWGTMWSQADTIVIPSSVTALPDGMFIDPSSESGFSWEETGETPWVGKTIKFMGTIEQWNALDKGNRNSFIKYMTVTCTDGVAEYVEPEKESESTTEQETTTTQNASKELTTKDLYNLTCDSIKGLYNKSINAIEDTLSLDECISAGYVTDTFDVTECYINQYQSGDTHITVNVPLKNNNWVVFEIMNKSGNWSADVAFIYENMSITEVNEQLVYPTIIHYTFDPSNGTANVENIGE